MWLWGMPFGVLCAPLQEYPHVCTWVYSEARAANLLLLCISSLVQEVRRACRAGHPSLFAIIWQVALCEAAELEKTLHFDEA